MNTTFQNFGQHAKERNRSIVMTKCVGSSFLKTGVILARFHCAGTTPSERDMLNKSDNDGAITSASSSNSRLGMQSGPQALLGSNWRSTSITSYSVNLMSERISFEGVDVT